MGRKKRVGRFWKGNVPNRFANLPVRCPAAVETPPPVSLELRRNEDVFVDIVRVWSCWNSLKRVSCHIKLSLTG